MQTNPHPSLSGYLAKPLRSEATARQDIETRRATVGVGAVRIRVRRPPPGGVIWWAVIEDIITKSQVILPFDDPDQLDDMARRIEALPPTFQFWAASLVDRTRRARMFLIYAEGHILDGQIGQCDRFINLARERIGGGIGLRGNMILDATAKEVVPAE